MTVCVHSMNTHNKYINISNKYTFMKMVTIGDNRHRMHTKNPAFLANIDEAFKDIASEELSAKKIKADSPYPGNKDCDEHDEP